MQRLVPPVLLLVLLVLAVQNGHGSPEDGCVVVTGVTGFVAGHITEILLKKGYTVHGTVRSLQNRRKYKFLEDIATETPGKLKFFEADLEKANAFDEAASSCWGFMHVASAVGQGTIGAEMVQQAIKGTLAAVNAAKTNGINSVVVTSSVASLTSRAKIEAGKMINENDWNDIAQLNYGNYPFSKTEAEKATLAWLENEIKEHGKLPFRYSSVHFPLAIGPQQSTRVTSSNTAVKIFLSGELPVGLPLRFNTIDVRDVARAHVHVLENKKASGRYIVAVDPKSSSLNPVDIIEILRENFRNYPVPLFSVELPFFITRLFSLLDGRLDAYSLDLASMMDRHPGYDGSRITRELGFEYEHLDMKQSIIDSANSMIKLGIVTKTRKTSPVVLALLGAFAIIIVLLIGCCAFMCSKSEPKAKQS